MHFKQKQQEKWLRGNENQTQYMFVNSMGRRDRLGQNVTINTYNYFERVESQKYLGDIVFADNDATKEIKGKMQSVNRCFNALNNIIKSKTLTRTSRSQNTQNRYRTYNNMDSNQSKRRQTNMLRTKNLQKMLLDPPRFDR